jgi:hypothetical protein
VGRSPLTFKFWHCQWTVSFKDSPKTFAPDMSDYGEALIENFPFMCTCVCGRDYKHGSLVRYMLVLTLVSNSLGVPGSGLDRRRTSRKFGRNFLLSATCTYSSLLMLSTSTM